jgi:uncharacterized protein (UPF0276 family)
LPQVLSTIACNLDTDIVSAALPLLEEERVEAIEWSFDTLYKHRDVPSWFTDLLKAFSNENRLIGHGVFFSLFSGRWSGEQQNWLDHLKKVSNHFHFDHITEHFGFMTGRDFHHGAPLNIPYSATTLAIGRDRLTRIYDACCCPVGLENLAFSYSPEEVKRHGDFLEQLVEPINGFIILDLHNLYCQLHNFSLPYESLINLYPLDRVREIHISGGSWEENGTAPARKVRRDTHDDSVPGEVFRLLEHTMDKCPNLKYVVMEQLGNGLKTQENKKAFYDDFVKMEIIVQAKNKIRQTPATNSFLPESPLVSDLPAEDDQLYQQQLTLSEILETSTTSEAARAALATSSLANTEWRVEHWESYMVETAMRIAQKWKKGQH